MELRKKYFKLKEKAKKALLAGKTKKHLQLLIQAEEVSFVMVRIK